MFTIEYERGPDGINYPKKLEETLFPGVHNYSFEVPEGSRNDFNSLVTLADMRYSKEHLKYCAYNNKLYPSLEYYSDISSSHLALPFTLTMQESQDVGTGLSANYLKNVIESITARLAVKLFEYKLTCEAPNVEYFMYRDTVERVGRALSHKINLPKLAVQVFHDAAIFCFSHVWMNPYTHEPEYLPDWSLGCFDSEFNVGKLNRCVVRKQSYPVAWLRPYLTGFTSEQVERIIEYKVVDLKIFIDCYAQETYVVINSECGPPQIYPFPEMQIETFFWDIGVLPGYCTCPFDLLYPLQRNIDKFLAKESQLVLNYKGPVPVFNYDVQMELKEMGNGAGEALFLRNPVLDASNLINVLEPTPLDTHIPETIEKWKGTMFELGNVQQVSLDIDQYRSAASMIALEQFRDASHQVPLQNSAEHSQRVLRMYIHYLAKMGGEPFKSKVVDWVKVDLLLENAVFNVKAVHNTGKDNGGVAPVPEVDYPIVLAERFLTRVMDGEKTFQDLSWVEDRKLVGCLGAVRLVQIKTLEEGEEGSVEVIDRLTQFLMSVFIDEVKKGQTSLVGGAGPGVPVPVGAGPEAGAGGSPPESSAPPPAAPSAAPPGGPVG